MNFKEICRTCLLPNETMFPIFSANVRLVDTGTDTAKIVDLLKMFTKLSLIRNDALPEKICSSCLDDTMRTYNFRIRCERSETAWKQSKNKENDKVCRTCLDSSDSMFTLYNQIVFTIGNESASVIDLIKNFTNILISLDDEFPKWICKACIDEMKISYALKVKCENSERTLEAYLKELAAKAAASAAATANGNQIVALNEMDISQLEFICMKEDGGGIENHDNFIKTEDCTNESVLSNDLNAKANGQQQMQQQQIHHQHQVQQQHQQQQQQHHHHQQQQQHHHHHHHQHHQQILAVAEPNLNATGNSSGQKVVKLDLLKLYPNSLLDQNFAIEEVIEDNMNSMTGTSYEQGIIRESIIDPNNIQLGANQEEIIEENINDSSLLIEDCEIEEVVENDQDNSDQFDGSAIDLDDSRGGELENDGTEEAYKCPGCSTVFLYNQTLRKHIFENHTNKELCMICNKVVYHNMWVHVMNHLPKNHHCPECGKGFISRSYVRSHLNNVHHNLRLAATATKRSQCPECSKTFEKKNDLHNHMLEHTNSYARCDCKTTSTTSTTTNISSSCSSTTVTSSTGIKQSAIISTATVVGATIITAPAANSATIAAVAAATTAQQKPQEKKPCIQPKTTFGCSECNREFPTQLALDTHVATKHSDEKNFKCTLCSSTFRLKGYLSKHVKNVHKKKCVNDFMEILGKS